MHHTVDYTGIADTKEKDAKAIDDIKSYLGQKEFERLNTIFLASVAKEGQVTLKQFEFLCAFGPGIEGYPVFAWYKFLFPTVEVSA